MNRDEHRAKALELAEYAEAAGRPANPYRMALLAEAQLHATLAITAPEAIALDPTPNIPRKRTAAKKVAESKETTK